MLLSEFDRGLLASYAHDESPAISCLVAMVLKLADAMEPGKLQCPHCHESDRTADVSTHGGESLLLCLHCGTKWTV